MPRFKARRPVRRGVECALRARAAAPVELSLKAGFVASYAKRSGRGVLVDLIVLIDVRGVRDCVEDGRRKDGGRIPQLSGGFGGIGVVCVIDGMKCEMLPG
jgi:hypothetical protein